MERLPRAGRRGLPDGNRWPGCSSARGKALDYSIRDGRRPDRSAPADPRARRLRRRRSIERSIAAAEAPPPAPRLRRDALRRARAPPRPRPTRRVARRPRPGPARRPGGLDQGPVRRRRRGHRRRLDDPARAPRRRAPTRPAVARLRRAGAALIGRTHMSEFAFSGVGINPHSRHARQSGDARARSDAARSRRLDLGRRRLGRRPARPGPRSAPTPAARSASRPRCKAWSASRARRAWCRSTGAVPLSTTLDTVSAITPFGARRRSSLHEILADRTRRSSPRRPLARVALRACRAASMLDGLDATVARAFERSLADAVGGRRAHRDDRARRRSTRSPRSTPPAASRPPRAGPSIAAGSPTREAEYDPRVALPHPARRGDERGRLHRPVAARRDWIAPHGSARSQASTPCSRRPCRWSRRRSRRCSPTTMRSSPPTACCCATRASSTSSTAARSACRATRAGELPVGLMVWHGAGRDDDGARRRRSRSKPRSPTPLDGRAR